MADWLGTMWYPSIIQQHSWWRKYCYNNSIAVSLIKQQQLVCWLLINWKHTAIGIKVSKVLSLDYFLGYSPIIQLAFIVLIQSSLHSVSFPDSSFLASFLLHSLDSLCIHQANSQFISPRLHYIRLLHYLYRFY